MFYSVAFIGKHGWFLLLFWILKGRKLLKIEEIKRKLPQFLTIFIQRDCDT